MPDDTIPLTRLPRELQSLTGQQPPTYRRCYQTVLDGQLPSEQVNGRHYVKRADLAAVAALFDLSMPKKPARTKSQQLAGAAA